MNRDELKRILRNQGQQLDAAVQKKIAYLQSDEAFSIPESTNKEGYNNQDDTSENTFDISAPETITHNPPQQQATASDNYDTNNNSVPTVDYYRANMAAKIAALRGISLPGDYIRKKNS